MNVVTENLDHAVEEFRGRHGLCHFIAFSGGASTDLPGVPKDDPLQKDYERIMAEREVRLVREVLGVLRHYKIAVLTGGTRFGFPKTAMETAKVMGIKTIGVFPKTAHDKGYVLPDIDLPICVNPPYGESAWGDESSVFAKLLDAVIVVGGGAGTLIEASHILKMNESLIKYGNLPKFVIPIHGTGGVADGLPFVWGKQEIKNACMPQKPVLSGSDAAVYIQECLDLFSISS